MTSNCGCMCQLAGHYGICQMTAGRDRRHIIRGLTITPDAAVCGACFDAVMHLAQDRLQDGRTQVSS